MNLRYLFLFSTLTLCTGSYSQKELPEDFLKNCVGLTVDFTNHESKILNSQVQPQSLIYDCNTVFWTVSTGGAIRQWDLVSNSVTGGAVVATNCADSFAFCGESSSLTFYSTGFQPTGILEYDPNLLVWNITTPNPIILMNGGGYYEDQFFLNYGGSVEKLYHFNGGTLNLVDTVTQPNIFAPYDIAVDSAGRAWVFTGVDVHNVTTLRIYDGTGVVDSYACTFNLVGSYGSFFINDQLYIGFINDSQVDPNFRNSIVPFNIDGSTVTAGTAIPFPYDAFTDMASCNKIQALSLEEIAADKNLTIYPNPVKNIINISTKDNVQSVSIYTSQGKFIETYQNSEKIDISTLQSGTYIIKILSESKIYYKKIIKI
jgi:hypothetical protein